jgi:Sensors of blue-light using FAD
MVRATQQIHASVFLSVNNLLTSAADIHAWTQQTALRSHASNITGMAVAGHDRWLCLLEGDQAQVEALLGSIQTHGRPRTWQVLMSNKHARQRLFPQRRLGWQADATPLQMAAFLSDLRRHSSASQVWHTSVEDALPWLEPS